MNILALVDRSIYAESVIEHTAWAAAEAGASVEIVHVIPPFEYAERTLATAGPASASTGAYLAELTRDPREEIENARIRAEVQLAEARAWLTSHGRLNVRTRVIEGNVPDVAGQLASESDLLVMGKRGDRADLARLPLGSNVETVARRHRGPILVVPRVFRPIHRALVALDTDPAAAAAVQVLVSGGFVSPMPVKVLHVGGETDSVQAALGSACHLLQAAGFSPQPELADGDPERVIAERVVQCRADLVVMGAFGRSRLGSQIFGSLTAAVLQSCQTAVLLAR